MQTLASKVSCFPPNIVSSPNPGKEFSCPSNATGCYLNQSNIPPLSLVKVGVVGMGAGMGAYRRGDR